ncbi:hypothetical protein [Zobellella endophytica]|uniref:hypothetical protein n=1 Tax=Zobellella endophytica TaxID=2116700 RepID=UPI0011B22D6E|nr:hypothetical protein [Zobellella endophytica]
MKIIIHIGTHKTGSTLIQKLCAQNHERLKDHGIHYPVGFFSQAGQHELAWAVKNNNHELADKLINDILHTCGSSHTIFLSSEEFEFINDFRYLREKLQDHSVEVVAFLRRQDKYLESEYNQHVKMFDVKFSDDIFKFFMYHNFEQRFNYHRLLHRWKENIPGSEVRAFSYDKAAKSGVLVQSFFRDILKVDHTKIIDEADLNKKSNVSINPLGLIYLARFNKEKNIDPQTYQRFIKNISEYDFPSVPGKKNAFLSTDFSRRIVSRYAMSNRQTVIKFCDMAGLFDEHFDDANVIDYYHDFHDDLYKHFLDKTFNKTDFPDLGLSK